MALTKLLYGPAEELSRIFPQNLFESPFFTFYWGFTIRLVPHKISRFCGDPAFHSNGQAKPAHFKVFAIGKNAWTRHSARIFYWGFTIRLAPHKISRFCGDPAFHSNGRAKPAHFKVFAIGKNAWTRHSARIFY